MGQAIVFRRLSGERSCPNCIDSPYAGPSPKWRDPLKAPRPAENLEKARSTWTASRNVCYK